MTPANRKATPRAKAFPEARATQKSATSENFFAAALKPGTLCFLTRIREFSDIVGRVVEVVAGPRQEYGAGPGIFYDIRADWICERFPGRSLIVVREQLIPITPDESASSAELAQPVSDLHVVEAA